MKPLCTTTKLNFLDLFKKSRSRSCDSEIMQQSVTLQMK